MRTFLTRAGLLLGAALALVGAASSRAEAQKVLVYCPVAIDDTGCNTIVSALSSARYLVEKGYDGTSGTVDLRTVDLYSYAAFVVPSLADDATNKPYALLRDTEVAEHLRAALIGGLAVWSGTPDQGSSNRAAKNTLIQNLVGWASASHATAKGPGLVALLDASDDEASRYDWLRAITPLKLTSDGADHIYDAVRALTPMGSSMINMVGSPMAYASMAAFGFQLPNGAAGASLDVVGQTGGPLGGQVVLVTLAAGNSSAAVVKTDKDDYAPGETVTITGSGFSPGETVTITLHEDPLLHDDRVLTATADASGSFVNRDFAPEQHHLGVRFVVTAVGATSGLRAQTTFTDGNRVTFSTTANGAIVTDFGSATTNQCVDAFAQERQGNNVDNGSHVARSVGLSSAPAGATFFAGGGCSGSPVTTVTIPANTPAVAFSFRIATAGSYTINGNAGLTGSNNASATVTISGSVATTTTISNVVPAGPASYGTPVTFTAIVSGSPSCGTVDFMDGATVLGSRNVTAGSASYTTTATQLGAATHSITAVYKPAPSGCSFSGSTSTAVSYTVSKATPTLAWANPADITYGTALGATQLNAVANGVSGALSGGTYAYTPAAGTVLNGGSSQPLKVDFTPSASDAANYTTASASVSINVTPAPQGIVFGALPDRQFGDAPFTLTASATSGLPVSYSASGSCTVSGPIVTLTGAGSCAITASQNGDANWAAAASVMQTFQIAKAIPTITWANPADIVYGTALGAAHLNATASVAGTFAYTPAAGTVLGAGNAQTLSVTFTPNDAANYGSATKTVTINVNKVAVTVTAEAKTKVYGDADPQLTYTVTGGALVDGDVITGSLTRASGSTVGTYAIQQGTLSAGSNYALTFVGADLTITPRPLNVTATADSKTYDGTATATVHLADDRVNSDAFTVAHTSATFSDKNVGTNKVVTVSGISVSGGASGNYALANTSTTATANITALGITASVTVDDKVYDGTTTATINGRTLAGVLGADAVALTGGTAAFSDRNVGTAKPVQITGLTLSGADAMNYSIGGTASAAASITPRPITVTADALSKTYGDPDPTLTYQTTSGSLVAGDAFNGALARDPGTSVGTYTITQGSLTAGNNYDLTFVGATLTITKRPVTVTADAKTKTYGDADPSLTHHISSGSLVAGDAFTGGLTRAAGENVGSYAIQQGTLALNGNYDLTYVGAQFTITQRPITLTADAKTKVYGEVDPALTYGITSGNLVGTDALTGALTRVSGEKVGAYEIQQGSVTAGGNYALTYVPANLTITPRPLTVTATGVDRVYDGTTTATVTLATNKLGNDAVTPSYASATFVDKNVGTGKAVSVSGISIGGTDATNYSLSNTTASTTANITARALVITAAAQSKVYDGNADATVTLADNRVPGDVFTHAFTSATFSDKNVGTGKTVTVSGITLSGTDAGNYAANVTATTTADISKLGITGSITANNKVYDGNVSATIATRSLVGQIASDDVSLTGGTATFADKHVGGGKTVTATALTLSGGDAGNYTVNPTATTTADITARPLVVTATGVHKEYDGLPTATVTLGDDRVSGDLLTLGHGGASFGDPNVGTGKPVSVVSIAVSGADAGNYTWNTTATTAANITHAPLTITADDKSMTFGDAQAPVYTATYAGFKNGESKSVLGGTLTFTTPVPINSMTLAGQYAITPSGHSAQNYAITYKPGTLTIVDKTAPVVSGTQANPGVVEINKTAQVTVTANITDALTGGSAIAAARLVVDGQQSYPMTGAFGSSTVAVSATVSLGYTSTGVHRLCVVGTDAAGNSNAEMDCALLASYDPNGSFVTGGGWIMSPLGAYSPNPSLTGKATFGFVSKYQKGANVPTGNTEFQFHAAGLDFKSTSFEWLVVSGSSKAQFKGSGTINGRGDYTFMITVIQGKQGKNSTPDTFRIKIQDKVSGGVIYDNMMGKSDTDDPTTALGGGSIVIH